MDLLEGVDEGGNGRLNSGTVRESLNEVNGFIKLLVTEGVGTASRTFTVWIQILSHLVTR